MSFPPNLLVWVSIENFKASFNLVLIRIWRTITHIVQDLVPNLVVIVCSQLKDSLPEFFVVPLDSARTHLLSSF